MQRQARMQKEMKMLEMNPPPGISCWLKNDKIDELEAKIVGNVGTPYHEGVFTLNITVPEKYPFVPPNIHFVTPIYHPNIDTAGRICLDILKTGPKGGWKPILNLSTVLESIRLLMAEPNPDDPLMVDVAEEYRYHHDEFSRKAKEFTSLHAKNQ